MEPITTTILGGLLGGAARLVPEVLNWMDRKDERKHELAMFDKQLAADQQRADNTIRQTETEGQIAMGTAELQALTEAIKGQTEMAVAAGGWAAKLSASVRPVLTYWWAVVLYTAALVCEFMLLKQNGLATQQAILAMWGPDEKALVSSLFMFWFVDRSLKAKK